MQSANYVPGVSGWKINIRTGEFEMADGVHVVEGRDPNLHLSMRLPMLTEAPEAKPFLVSSDRFAVKVEKNGNGDVVCAGIGQGLSEFEKAEAKGAGAVLDYICAAICDTQLGQELKSRTNELSESVRQILRQELRPGGLLHRH